MHRVAVALASATIALSLAGAASAGTALAPCGDVAPGALCGLLEVPLDRAVPDAGTIPISFELHPRRDQSSASLGTVVAVQGGPGGPSTDLRFIYDFLGPLFDRRELLIVDVRGTGMSRAIDCPAVQISAYPTLEEVAECGSSLGNASDLYTSVDAADDIDDVRQALGIGQLDFYGVSYGTEVGHVYAVRHGDRLRTLVLDSALPIWQRPDLYDFDRITGRALLTAVSRLCERSYLCQKVGGDVDDRMRSLISHVRRHPVEGHSYSPLDGSRVPVTFDEATLIASMSGYGFEAGQVEIDGAATALRSGDPKPILRLGAEAVFGPGQPDPTLFSAGDFWAVVCTEVSFPWNVSDSPEARLAKWEAAWDAIPDGSFAPFSVPAWREASRLGFVGLLFPWQCAGWPQPDRDVPQLVPPSAERTTAPTLVINGDLDKVTPADAARAVADAFPNGTFVEFASVGHGVAFSGPCAAVMVMTFVETMDPGDTACASDPPPTYGYTTFPLDAADEIRPVSRARGDRSTRRDRKAVAAMVDTIFDGLFHTSTGRGLRGGRVSPFPEFVEEFDWLRFRYDRARFVRDVAVSGHIYYALREGNFFGEVRIQGRGTDRGRLSFLDPWYPFDPIYVEGTIGGRRIVLELPDVT